MKTSMLNLILILAIFFSSSNKAFADGSNLKKEFQSLGDNQDVIDRVKKLDNQQRVRVVQNRLMDRNNRIEAALDLGYITGGDGYVQTRNMGGLVHYHITPRWSLGFIYEKSYNTLNSEGTRLYDTAYQCQQTDIACSAKFPAVDFPLETKLLTINFYPVYGKMNLFDSAIAQFDLYTSLGYGKKTLNSGESNVFSAGVGVGVWINSFVTARVEARFENYTDLLQTEKRNQNSLTAVASLGMMVW